MANLMFVTGSSSPGGAEKQTVALVNGLADRGHQCHAVCVKETGDLLDRIRSGGGGTARCLGASRYLGVRALVDLAEQLRVVRPAAIVAANGYALMYSWLALRLSRLRAALVVSFHSNRLLGPK